MAFKKHLLNFVSVL